jgi:hypothetical protein
LSKTTVDSLSLPSWFTSAGLAWNLSGQFWVSIALVGNGTSSSLGGNSSLGSSTIVNSVIVWAANLSETTMDGLGLPSWFTSAGFAWNLSGQLWVGIAFISD